jgi:hypothetical protein
MGVSCWACHWGRVYGPGRPQRDSHAALCAAVCGPPARCLPPLKSFPGPTLTQQCAGIALRRSCSVNGGGADRSGLPPAAGAASGAGASGSACGGRRDGGGRVWRRASGGGPRCARAQGRGRRACAARHTRPDQARSGRGREIATLPSPTRPAADRGAPPPRRAGPPRGWGRPREGPGAGRRPSEGLLARGKKIWRRPPPAWPGPRRPAPRPGASRRSA